MGAYAGVCVCVRDFVRVCVPVWVGGASFNALPALTRVSSPSSIVVVIVVAVLETRCGLEVGRHFFLGAWHCPL